MITLQYGMPHAAAFMAQILGLKGAAALSDLAQTVPDSGGTTFVPALALGPIVEQLAMLGGTLF